jgi:hypothetical protein
MPTYFSTPSRLYLRVVMPFAGMGVSLPEEKFENRFGPLITIKDRDFRLGLATSKNLFEGKWWNDRDGERRREWGHIYDRITQWELENKIRGKNGR